MKLKSILLTSILFSTSSFAINCGDFGGEFATHNGHYYAITGNKMTFETAKQFATANGGYLAIPNTTAENDFIKGIVGANNEAFLGIYDPSYSQNFCLTGNCFSTNRTRFKTVSGASLTYQNWDSNDVENKLLNGDDSVDLYGNKIIQTMGEPYTLISGTSGLWRDWGTHFISGDNPMTIQAVIEFDTKPTCYESPSGVTDEITGRKCNSQIWSDTVGIQEGTTAECLNDINNVEYCPQALAECGQSWEYEDGYSVISEPQFIYLPKVYQEYNDSWGGRWFPKDDFTTWYDRGGGVSCRADTRGNYGSNNHYFHGMCYTGSSMRGNACYGGRSGGHFYRDGTLDDYSFVKCRKLVCPSGYTDVNGICQKVITQEVSASYTYYNYLCSDNYTATNNGGDCKPASTNDLIDTNSDGIGDSCNSSTPPANNCKREKFTCQADEPRPCALVDSKMQCSPFPCLGESNFENAGSVMGANDKNNDGWSNDGNCAGQIYIFGGKDSRCRSSDKVFGLTGGGCCDKDKVALGLVSCKDDEKMLAKKNQSEFCHYVGEYCSKKIKLGVTKVCVQDSKSYCCFNSKLARIIHEQGRPQIGLSWGSSSAPDCRGFKPEEFQKLDMSKMDFSSAFKDIKVNAQNITTVTTNLKNKVNNIQVPK